MESNFWTLLDEYKRMKKRDVIKSDQSNFVNDYHTIHRIVSAKMFGPLGAERSLGDLSDPLGRSCMCRSPQDAPARSAMQTLAGPDVLVNGESIFGEAVGADDGHDDLIDFLIWNGKETVNKFLQDPSSALPLAKRMHRNPLFDGDINIMKRLIGIN